MVFILARILIVVVENITFTIKIVGINLSLSEQRLAAKQGGISIKTKIDRF